MIKGSTEGGCREAAVKIARYLWVQVGQPAVNPSAEAFGPHCSWLSMFNRIGEKWREKESRRRERTSSMEFERNAGAPVRDLEPSETLQQALNPGFVVHRSLISKCTD